MNSSSPRYGKSGSEIDPGHGGIDEQPPGFGGDDDGSRRPEQTPPPEGYLIGIWVALVSVTMMFIALTSAYIYNQAQIRPLVFPSIFLISTIFILACSISIECARQVLRHRHEAASRRWLWLTMLFGVGFLAAQVGAWRQLIASGFYVNTNHHSGYAYIFTFLHAAHLIGGLLALAYVIFKTKRGLWTAVRRRASLDATALYWHFLDGLWLYLLVLLFVWK